MIIIEQVGNFVIVHSDEPVYLPCDRCNSQEATPAYRNTRYEGEWNNVVCLCPTCEAEEDSYWNQMWKEYYGGLL